MFCIAAFIIFAILGIFSASYRQLAKRAWQCVWKKIRLKPCDINFQEEMKSRLLGRLVVTKPRLARFLDRWIGALSILFVVLSIWSLVIVVNSGLNLFVYDTCNPNNAESCSLGGEACGINTGKPGFWTSLKTGQVVTWATDGATTFGQTVSRIPNRLKTWDAKEYVSEANTYYTPYDPAKPTALEIIDPGCKFCAKLFGNIKQTGFADKYNLTYLVYPIPDSRNENGYRFPHSRLIASYTEAAKLYPLDSSIPADWQILEKVFTGKDADGISFQEKINVAYTEQETESLLLSWLKEMGYSETQLQQIKEAARSGQIKDSLNRQKDMVENKIQTIKIPTIMFDGRRYDRAVGPEKLQ